MMLFIPPKRKLLELILLLVMALILYFIFNSLNAVVLFCFGFIWNWSASNDLSGIFENKRYRFSMLRMVVNLQNLFLKPFHSAPQAIKLILRILPAGIFWSLVIFINESAMPWWCTFLGSLAFELMQLELNFIKSQKDQP